MVAFVELLVMKNDKYARVESVAVASNNKPATHYYQTVHSWLI